MIILTKDNLTDVVSNYCIIEGEVVERFYFFLFKITHIESKHANGPKKITYTDFNVFLYEYENITLFTLFIN